MATNNNPIPDDGLTLVYDACEDAQVDIIFVHGLRGHPQKTWEAVDPNDPSEKIFWPGDLLPNTVPASRILSFGYPTEFGTFYPKTETAGLVVHASIDGHSTSLIRKLGLKRRETRTEERPIFFIAHSLGGLVCANGLSRRSGPDDSSQKVIDNTCGMIFLGTPFQGSSAVTWAKLGEKFFRLFGDSSDQTIKDLDKDSIKLKDISRDFHLLLRERCEPKASKPIQVACFVETKSTIVKGPLGKKDLGRIVEAESATLAGYRPIPINADHRSMCKFTDEETTGYIDLTGTLKSMIANVDKDTDQFKAQPTGISLGDVRHGDYGVNYGIVSGHVVGTTRDAVNQTVQHTFNNFGEGSGAEKAIAAFVERQRRKDND